MHPNHTLNQNSPEQIAKHYSAALDSVNLINRLLAKEVKTEEDTDAISRNAAHLKIMVAKTFWTTEDLSPLSTAVASAAVPHV